MAHASVGGREGLCRDEPIARQRGDGLRGLGVWMRAGAWARAGPTRAWAAVRAYAVTSLRRITTAWFGGLGTDGRVGPAHVGASVGGREGLCRDEPTAHRRGDGIRGLGIWRLSISSTTMRNASETAIFNRLI
jgi:hypothetical protein